MDIFLPAMGISKCLEEVGCLVETELDAVFLKTE
jgi:hypothetical protein